MRQLGRLLIRGGRRQDRRAQATTELAIMGAIVIMILSQLLQQGYLYNCKQALEMYTFRQALKLSRDGMYHPQAASFGKKKLPVGINLTVIRDVFVPSFFTGLNRQTLQATASVEYNPYILYTPEENSPQDLPTRQLIQVNDAMIRKGYFIEIPPTLVAVTRVDDSKDKKKTPEYSWVSSSIANLDFESSRKSDYTYTTRIKESVRRPGKKATKWIEKKLSSTDTISGIISFDDAKKIEEDYRKDKEVETVYIRGETIPKELQFTLEEKVSRERIHETEMGD